VLKCDLVCGRIQGVVEDNCTLRVGEWEIKGIPQAVRSEQGTRSGHPVCVPVLSLAQLSLHPLEKVGFGRVVNENSGVVCREKHDSRGLIARTRKHTALVPRALLHD
jgi:hypothetical protein